MIPNDKELLSFVKKQDLVNISMIAREFDIKNATASDIVMSLVKKKLLKVKKFGGSKVVMLR